MYNHIIYNKSIRLCVLHCLHTYEHTQGNGTSSQQKKAQKKNKIKNIICRASRLSNILRAKCIHICFDYCVFLLLRWVIHTHRVDFGFFCAKTFFFSFFFSAYCCRLFFVLTCTSAFLVHILFIFSDFLAYSF